MINSWFPATRAGNQYLFTVVKNDTKGHVTYEKSIFIISYKCSDGIKVSLSFKIFLQTFTDQNVPLPLFIEFFAQGMWVKTVICTLYYTSKDGDVQ